jgi:hypothetical protein
MNFISWRIGQSFGCHPEDRVFCDPKDLGEPRDAPRSLRRTNRAFGSHPYSTRKCKMMTP